MIVVNLRIMPSNYIEYINSFKRYEPSDPETNSQFPNLSQYSTFINNKANEIFSMAESDHSIDSQQLQKEINEMGKTYVKSFLALSKQKS